MTTVVPAILPKSFEEIERKLARVQKLVDWVQIDFCDGLFVTSKTWPYTEGGIQLVRQTELPYWQDLNFEFDLMVKNPHEILEDICDLGAGRIVLHIECTSAENIGKAIREAEHLDIAVHIAFQNGTPLAQVEKILAEHPYVAGVQCMGISTIGIQGADFDERVLENIKALRNKYPELTIAVDGGVSLETAPLLVAAGANTLVSGSAIFESGDVTGTIEMLRRL